MAVAKAVGQVGVGDEEHAPLVVVQPTAFCNLDCTYCYVEGRKDPTRMNLDVVRAIADHACAYFDRADILFHSGEPLTVGIEWFRSAVEAFTESTAKHSTSVRFGVQTNGVLVDSRWTKFFSEHDFLVGLSLDGPAWLHDQVRVGTRGQATHARVERGLRRLQDAGLEPTVLAVLTEEALNHPVELYEYFSNLGIRRVGLNVEDATGAHVSSLSNRPTAVEDAYSAFIEGLIERAAQDVSPVSFREITQTTRAMLFAHADGESSPAPDVQKAMKVVSYDVAGNFGTFCPELMTAPANIKDRFLLGNVATLSLRQARRSLKLYHLVGEIETGVQGCKETCSHFSICGGGKPSTKVFELGDLKGTETLSCRLRVQAVARGVAKHVTSR